MDHKRAKPWGSTIRKKTIKAPKIISSAWDTPAVVMVMPSRLPNAGSAWLKKMGSKTMKAAPKKLPMMEPSPPMMTMKSN